MATLIDDVEKRDGETVYWLTGDGPRFGVVVKLPPNIAAQGIAESVALALDFTGDAAQSVYSDFASVRVSTDEV